MQIGGFMSDHYHEQREAEIDRLELTNIQGPIKSDGLSSSYYVLNIDGHTIQTEDIIKDVFGNDFDFGTVFKSLVRAYACTQGAGKAGNDLRYELNKIKYSTDKIARLSNV